MLSTYCQGNVLIIYTFCPELPYRFPFWSYRFIVLPPLFFGNFSTALLLYHSTSCVIAKEWSNFISSLWERGPKYDITAEAYLWYVEHLFSTYDAVDMPYIFKRRLRLLTIYYSIKHLWIHNRPFGDAPARIRDEQKWIWSILFTALLKTSIYLLRFWYPFLWYW